MLLVVDAMTGQDAVNVAEQFAETVQFDGVVMTKLDGDARGGAALSVKAVTGKPILFASTGEKLDQFERFHPDRMAQRILGMGDVMTLIEKAEGAYDEQQAAELERKLRKQEFGLDDFLDQLRQIRRLGPLQSLLGMIPGMGKELRGVKVDERRVRPDPGDHPGDDPPGAPAPRADQRLAPAADRARLGNQRAGRQAADQAVRADAQGDAPGRAGADARPGRLDEQAHANLVEHMAVRLRLTRIGSHKNPIWRVVVADQRSPRDGRVIETVGHYNAQTNPSTIVLDEDRIRDWLARGAQPSGTVKKLLRTQGIS